MIVTAVAMATATGLVSGGIACFAVGATARREVDRGEEVACYLGGFYFFSVAIQGYGLPGHGDVVCFVCRFGDIRAFFFFLLFPPFLFPRLSLAPFLLPHHMLRRCTTCLATWLPTTTLGQAEGKINLLQEKRAAEGNDRVYGASGAVDAWAAGG